MLVQKFQLRSHNTNNIYFFYSFFEKETMVWILFGEKITQIGGCIYASIFKLAKISKVNVLVKKNIYQVRGIKIKLSGPNFHILTKLFTNMDICWKKIFLQIEQ